MKKCFFLFCVCVFPGLGASAQLLGPNLLNGEPQMLVIPDHPQHAMQTPLAQAQDLLEHSGYSYAQGERPLWEFMPAPPPGPSLGDVAREFRQEHVLARKAVKTWRD